MVEWSNDNPKTSQKSYWSNQTSNRWTSFGVAAQHFSCWPGNSLNLLKTSKADLQASFKNKKGRNSLVLGHFKCSKSWPPQILQKAVAYFPTLITIWLTFSIGFSNGLEVRIFWLISGKTQYTFFRKGEFEIVSNPEQVAIRNQNWALHITSPWISWGDMSRLV